MSQAQTVEKTDKKAALKARKISKALGRKKRKTKLLADATFAKAYFESKSKRSNDKKVAFRKKKSRKK